MKRFVILAALVSFSLVGCSQPTPTASETPTGITPAKFQEVIGSEKLVLLKFGATWCGPCVSTDAELKKIEPTLGDDVEVLKVDVDANPDLASQFDVSSIPRLMLFRGGEVVDDRVGGMSADQLTSWIDENRGT